MGVIRAMHKYGMMERGRVRKRKINERSGRGDEDGNRKFETHAPSQSQSPFPKSVSISATPSQIQIWPLPNNTNAKPRGTLPLFAPRKTFRHFPPLLFPSCSPDINHPPVRHHGTAHHLGIPHSLSPFSALMRQVVSAHETFCARARHVTCCSVPVMGGGVWDAQREIRKFAGEERIGG